MSNKAEVKPHNYKELEGLYGVSHKTFKKWLKTLVPDLEPVSGRYFTVKQVQLIFDRLGIPSESGT